jgi:methyl-accepting chemotaxis protein
MNALAVSATIKRTRLSMLAMLCVSLVVVGLLLVSRHMEIRDLGAIRGEQQQLTEQNAAVLLADEILTMSARMYAATGNGAWKKRYDDAVPMIDKALAGVIALAPQDLAERFKAETSDANDKLIALETRSAELAAKADLVGAQAVLDSKDYADQKTRLAEGSDRFIIALQDDIALRLSANERRGNVIGLAGLIAIAAIISVWFWLNRNLTLFTRNFHESEQARLSSEAQRHAADTKMQDVVHERFERQQHIDEAISDFRQSIGKTGVLIQDGVKRLETTSTDLGALSVAAKKDLDETTDLALMNGTMARQVADAAEELRTSVDSMASQMAGIQASAVATSALADESNAKVTALSHAARQIETIVDVIRSVADQTNLLALNATIEAARAGDAGRGFAVVASEVKSLANQTAEATMDISRQIGEIRDSINATVETIEKVVENVDGVEAAVSTMTGMITDQSSTTDELSRSATHAAESTNSLRNLIAKVSDVLVQSKEAAQSISEVSQGLTRGSASLDTSIEAFLKRTDAA